MMITVLAVVMTFVMLLATLFKLHQEADRVRINRLNKRTQGFGWE